MNEFVFYPDDSEILQTRILISSFKYFWVIRIKKNCSFLFWEKLWLQNFVLRSTNLEELEIVLKSNPKGIRGSENGRRPWETGSSCSLWHLQIEMWFLGKVPLFNIFDCWLLRDCPPLETTFLDRTVVSQSGDSHFMAETRKTTLETKVTLKSTFKCRATGLALNLAMWAVSV